MSKRNYKKSRNTGKPSKRKFKGFNFYLMQTDKLSKKNRKEFLYKSSTILQKVFHSLSQNTDSLMGKEIHSEMDSNLSDLELLDQWNHMYDTYGYLMDELNLNGKKNI